MDTKKALAFVKKQGKEFADKAVIDTLKDSETLEILQNKAKDFKDLADIIKDDVDDKIHELDKELDLATTNYNDAYTLMSDSGLQLHISRTRAADMINCTEALINSIANRPKEFNKAFEEFHCEKETFLSTCDFADKELKAAREAASGAGAGLFAGASVASMAPTAAMWVATTFGTASTGAAISTLSGAAATNAALAWLGGGTLAAGGGGVAAGQALLAMAGPIGWTISGATLLASITLFTKKKIDLERDKGDQITAIKKNTEATKESHLQITELLNETEMLRTQLTNVYTQSMSLYGKDYLTVTEEDKMLLGNLVNTVKALSALLNKTVDQGENNEVQSVEE